MTVQELGYQKTPLGELTLRRRLETRLNNREVFEVKLGDEYLMSSLFTEAEQQLATLGLAELEGSLDVVIGGLGLGYTAAEALKNKNVSSLLVIDLFQTVIDWHREGFVPLGRGLRDDPRCELRQGDFFALAHTGFDTADLTRKFDAVLLDMTLPGGLSGLEVAKEMLRLDSYTNIVATSGYFEEGASDQEELSIFSAILPKPYSVTSLSEAIESALVP